MNRIAPTADSKTGSYHCPHCGAYAQHTSIDPDLGFSEEDKSFYNMLRTPSVWKMSFRECHACSGFCMFDSDGKLVFPYSDSSVPPPNPQMLESAKALYLEARQISLASPRAAGALLRLALQYLCEDLTGQSGRIDSMIGALKERGMPERIVELMDIIRVVGNEAVHPGELNLNERPETVNTLFTILNLVTQELVAIPDQISALFASLPASAQAKVKQRSKKKPARTDAASPGDSSTSSERRIVIKA